MKADTITKDYISDTTVFADIFNYYIYNGKQVIIPEQLKERDPVKVALPYGANDALVPVQRARDKQNLYSIMTDGKMQYVLLGAESQAKIQYAMPVKNNLYDALDYVGQVEEAARSHRQAMWQERENRKKRKKRKEGQGEQGSLAERARREPQGRKASEPVWKKPNSGEFLSGFWRNDRLIPSLTVTVYFGCEEWDGPLSLFEMLEVPDPRLIPFLDNYHVHLLAPARMSDAEIMKLQSNLREVFLFIKYSKDKQELNRVLEAGRERFGRLGRRAVDVIEVITKMGLEYDAKEDEVDMCEAIAQMRAEERQLGREEERREMCEAIAQMRAEERQLGREEERREMCEAIAQMRAEERQLGREQGREEERREMSGAIAQMRAEERQLGREQGREEERREMCGAIAQMRAEERQLGEEEGKQLEREKVASKLLQSGKFSKEEILDFTGLTPEQLEKLISRRKNSGKESFFEKR